MVNKQRTENDDFANAERGFIAALEPGVIKNADGRVVWDCDAFQFLNNSVPESANPSLWRQGQLCAKHGLFKVVEGIYQVRGLDISNITFVEGEQGVIVIDPLISTECAAAAIGLYRQYRGDRPVTGLIYSHSHGDHFGGSQGVTDGRNIPIVAPAGFMEHAVSENIYVGPAMSRRGNYMYGSTMPPGATGNIGVGLGLTTSAGTFSLIPPTLNITRTGQEETIDGVRIVFHLTPGTEAPAEMNFYFPDFRALCMAENTTHTMHNILTLRGALVRDARQWSRYISEAMIMFADKTDVVFASHHWPTWGDSIRPYLTTQRDLYAYLHDQTLRFLNKGFTGSEIAEIIELPESLTASWSTHGYYGSVSHNVKAIYQRYMGWFDGNPVSLIAHPPQAAAQRYAESFGGVERIIEIAEEYRDNGDMRFAAELLNHAVYAEPNNIDARSALAGIYRKLSTETENGTWRNFFLTGAQELDGGIKEMPLDLGGMGSALNIEQIFDTIAIRIAPERAVDASFAISWRFTDLNENYRMELSHSALVHWQENEPGEADVSITLRKEQLANLLSGDMGGITIDGDATVIENLTSIIDDVDLNFPIVTPRSMPARQAHHGLTA